MCLAIPGRVESLQGNEPMMRSGRVRFGDIIREINLAYVPEARVGDYVLAHVGVAIGVIDEVEAMRTLAELKSLGESPQDSSPPDTSSP